MGIIQKKPSEPPKQKSIKAFLMAWLSILTSLLIIVLYLTMKTNNPVIMVGKSYIKEKKTGLVTVVGNEGVMICQFYDSMWNGIAQDCPDTVWILKD